MSNKTSSAEIETCSDFLGAAAGWSRAHRRTYFLFSLAGGMFAALLHLFGPRFLPGFMSGWWLYLDFAAPLNLAAAALFWVLLCLLLSGLVGYGRIAGFKSLIDGSVSAGRGWQRSLRAEPSDAFRTISFGLAIGFLLVAFFGRTDFSAGFISSLPTPPSLQTLAIVGLIILACSKLSRFVAHSIQKRRATLNESRRAITSDRLSLVFAACALPLIATLPIGSWQLTTRAAILLAGLGLLVWTSSRHHPGTANLWFLLLGGAAFIGLPHPLLAEDGFLDTAAAAPLTKEQWVNAFLGFAAGFAGSGAGAALGHALGEASAVRKPATVSAPAPVRPATS